MFQPYKDPGASRETIPLGLLVTTGTGLHQAA